MEFKIKMNADELQRAVDTGALLNLAKCDSTRPKEPVRTATLPMKPQTEEPVRTATLPMKPQTEEPVRTVTLPMKPQTEEPPKAVAEPEPEPVEQTPEATNVPVDPHFTRQQIALMGAKLCDEGKREDILALLKEFNVQAVTEIPDDKIDDYAERLLALDDKEAAND